MSWIRAQTKLNTIKILEEFQITDNWTTLNTKETAMAEK